MTTLTADKSSYQKWKNPNLHISVINIDCWTHGRHNSFGSSCISASNFNFNLTLQTKTWEQSEHMF